MKNASANAGERVARDAQRVARISVEKRALWRSLYRLQGSEEPKRSKTLHLDNCTKNDSKKGQLRNGVIGRARNRRGVARRTKGEKQEPKYNDFRETIGLRIESDEKIKQRRAQGGCPGTIRRRRSWQAAKSYGEPQAGIDP